MDVPVVIVTAFVKVTWVYLTIIMRVNPDVNKPTHSIMEIWFKPGNEWTVQLDDCEGSSHTCPFETWKDEV